MRRAIKSLARLLVATMFFAAAVASESRADELDKSLTDGWNAWRVAAGPSRATRCCFRWNMGQPASKPCNLDNRRSVSIVSDGGGADTGELQVYAFVESGRATKIQALSPDCPVTSATDIEDLGLREAAESINWLQTHVSAADELAESALSAIAGHEGAFPALISTVENRRLDMDLREQALHWMAMSDSDEVFAYISALVSEN